MRIKEVKARIILDSRKQKTIEVIVNGCCTSAPSGKSKGIHEAKSYKTTIIKDIIALKKLVEISEINSFKDLKKVEKLLKNKIGANTLFAVEASILKALAKERKKELWQLLGGKKLPKLLSNTVGGGTHSYNQPKPDFQEFLIIGDKKNNQLMHKEIKKVIKSKKKNDENAWQTELGNELILELFDIGNINSGIDIAASQFYSKNKYHYKNPKNTLNRDQQIKYIINIIKKYKLKYVEDPLEEDDFKGFARILKNTNGCLIVGDDLTTTNLKRVRKAIKMKSINGLIVKPNQIGSLLEVREVISLCKKHNIKIIISHRSGETLDDTIADLAVGWGADMIKIPVVGKERLAKVNRLEKIKRVLGRI